MFGTANDSGAELCRQFIDSFSIKIETKRVSSRKEQKGIRLVNSTARGESEFGRSVSGCPGGGRKFGDSTDWKITQSRQDGTQIVADRDFESPTGFDH
jgi:hypothetical protein